MRPGDGPRHDCAPPNDPSLTPGPVRTVRQLEATFDRLWNLLYTYPARFPQERSHPSFATDKERLYARYACPTNISEYKAAVRAA